MKLKFVSWAFAIGCVFLMTSMTFQPAVATSGPGGVIAMPETIRDQDGNSHMVYSQMVETGSQPFSKWQFDIFYKNNIGLKKGWNTPIQISHSDTDSVMAQVSIDDTTGLLYIAWIEKEWRSNEFWYAGTDDFATFTYDHYGAEAPWPTAANLDLDAGVGILDISWKPAGFLSLAADIDGDLIIDIYDDEPTTYNVDNPEIELEVDVIATESETGVTVVVDYTADETEIPTIETADGDFALSTGDYIDINLDTTEEFKAIIKMPISEEIPPTLNYEYLRMYRQVDDDWAVVTDWENEEFTGINIVDGYVWAYVEHFSVYTPADASAVDGDGDGLTDLTEDTEPPTGTTITLTKDNFDVTHLDGSNVVTAYLTFDIAAYNDYYIPRGWIKIDPHPDHVVDNLVLDIGADGTYEWQQAVPSDIGERIGAIRHSINEFLFNSHINNDVTAVSIPFQFSADSNINLFINGADITLEDITTYNYESDTSLDDLYDGWQDKDGDFTYNRAGVDGVLGTADDENPGARWHDKDPTDVNIIGSKGNVQWNEYQEGINQVNGNLAITSTDVSIKTLGHQLELSRTYNSLNALVDAPFGWGWQHTYGERLNIRSYFVDYVSGDGAYYEFENLGDNTFASPIGSNLDMIRPGDDYLLRSPDGSMKVFDEFGKLSRIEDKYGNTLNFLYTDSGPDGKLIQVSDDSGFYLDFTYTGDGNYIRQVTDSSGRINSYIYDPEGMLISRSDAMGNTYHYKYKVVGAYRVLYREINPLGLLKEYSYTNQYTPKANKIDVGEYDFNTGTPTLHYTSYEMNYDYPGYTSVSDANTYSTLRIFDKEGVTTKAINADSTEVDIEYDDLKPIEINDERGYVWVNEYNVLGHQVKEEDPTGKSSITEWTIVDSISSYNSIPVAITDKRNYTTSFEYDSKQDPTNVIDAQGHVTTYDFNVDGMLNSLEKPNGAVSDYTYDIYGNLLTQTNAMSYVTSHTYDSLNRRASSTDARGFTTTFVYDGLDRLVEKIDPLGNSETYTYDAVGNLLSTTNTAGFTTTYTYDIYNRKISETDPLGNTMTNIYDDAGNIIETIDKRGYSTYFTFDEMNRVIMAEDALGFYEQYVYDEAGNKIQTIDKMGNYWNTTYDELGNRIADYCPYDVAILYEYDEEGRVTKKIDRMGYETLYEYDENGRQIRILGAEGSDTRYSYDSVGNLRVVSQIDGTITSSWEYDYDPLGRKIWEVTPLGFEYTWSYDELGNVIEYYDAEGTITEYQYDGLNRMTNLTLPGVGLQAPYEVNITYIVTESERQEYDYPPIMVLYGLPTSMMPMPPALMAQEKEYDGLGRVVREMWAVNDIESFQFGDTEFFNITYEYDENGNVIQMTDQADLVTTYTYNELNQMLSLTDPDDDTTTYDYYDNGQLYKTTYQTGSQIYQEYNKANLLTGIYNVRSDNSIISSFEYTYNFNANRMSVTEADGSTTSYTYDMENHLTSVTYPNSDQALYSYDNKNNMISNTQIIGGVSDTTTNIYDIENRMIQSGNQTYEYDANGNMVKSEANYGYYSTYLNGQKVNWFASVGSVGGGGDPVLNSAGGEPALFSTPEEITDSTPATTYGFALDGRRVGKAGAADMFYLYDGDNVVYEIWDDKTVRFTHSGFTDHPISIDIDGVKYYYLYDGLGSVTELIDDTESVVNRYRYDPFGEAIVRQEAVYNPHQFTGRQYDVESGMYHYRARAYSSSMGRFLQMDSLGMADGVNMYAYVMNNPINNIDPSGGMTWTSLIGAYWGGKSLSMDRFCHYWIHGERWKVRRDDRMFSDVLDPESKKPMWHCWRAHFFTGCKMQRYGCHRYATYIAARGWEPLEKLMFGDPDDPLRDTRAVLWGHYYGKKEGRISCKTLTYYKVPIRRDTNHGREWGFGYMTGYADRRVYAPYTKAYYESPRFNIWSSPSRYPNVRY